MSTAAESKPIRVRLRRTKGWRLPPNTVKVDRTTKWGNPFVVDGNRSSQRAVEEFAGWIRGENVFVDMDANFVCTERKPPTLEVIRRELGGKNLACWCKVGDCCHADVLLAIATPSPSLPITAGGTR